MSTTPAPLEEGRKPEPPAALPPAPVPAPEPQPVAPAGVPGFLQPERRVLSSEGERREREELAKERKKEEEPR